MSQKNFFGIVENKITINLPTSIRSGNPSFLSPALQALQNFLTHFEIDPGEDLSGKLC